MSERENPAENADEVRQRNIEESRRLIEEKKKDRAQGDIHDPNWTDPRHADQSVPPGQADVPRGMTTGRGMGGGTAKKRDHQG